MRQLDSQNNHRQETYNSRREILLGRLHKK